MTAYEFIKKCVENGWALRVKFDESWHIEIKGEPADKVNEAIEMLGQDMTFEARVLLALAHYHAFYDGDSIVWDLVEEQQFIRADEGLPTDAVLAVLDKMGRNPR